MSNFTNEDIVKALGNMTIPQIVSLTKQLETQWGVQALPPVVEIKEAPKPPEVKTEFTVMLLPVTAATKMNTIKAVREIMNIGLKEAKELVEKAPVMIKDSVSIEEANLAVAKLTDVGALTEVR